MLLEQNDIQICSKSIMTILFALRAHTMHDVDSRGLLNEDVAASCMTMATHLPKAFYCGCTFVIHIA